MHSPEQMKRFASAMFTFIQSDRFKFLPKPLIEERLEICKQCTLFDPKGKRCRICGCGCDNGVSIFNKLSLPSEECPHHPPKWSKLTQEQILEKMKQL